jgi:hypothetical protein
MDKVFVLLHDYGYDGGEVLVGVFSTELICKSNRLLYIRDNYVSYPDDILIKEYEINKTFTSFVQPKPITPE